MIKGKTPIYPIWRTTALSKWIALIQHAQQVLPIAIFLERLGQALYLGRVDKTFSVGNLFGAGHLEALPVFNGFDEIGSFDQRLVRARVQPGITPAHHLDRQGIALQVQPVDVGDLQFTPCRRLEVCRHVDHGMVVKIQTRHRVVGLRFGRLFLQRDGMSLAVKSHHAVTSRVRHMVGKHRGAAFKNSQKTALIEYVFGSFEHPESPQIASIHAGLTGC